MECENVQQALSAYLDQELSDFEAKKIERHLNRCEGCRLDYQTLQDTVDKLDYYPQIEADDGFSEEVMQRIKKEKSLSNLVFEDWLSKFILSHKLAITVIASLLLLCIILVFTVINRSSTFIVGNVFYHLFSSSYFVGDNLVTVYPKLLLYLEGAFLISLIAFIFMLKQVKEWNKSSDLNNKLNEEN